MTTAEEVIEEIRESRRRISEECGHDLATYIAHLKRLTRKYSRQVQMYHKQQRLPKRAGRKREMVASGVLANSPKVGD